MVGSLTSKQRIKRPETAENAAGAALNRPTTKSSRGKKRERIRLVFSCLTSTHGGVAISLSKTAKKAFLQILTEIGFDVEFAEVNDEKHFGTEKIDDLVCLDCRSKNDAAVSKATHLLHYTNSIGYAGFIPVCEKHMNQKQQAPYSQ